VPVEPVLVLELVLALAPGQVLERELVLEPGQVPGLELEQVLVPHKQPSLH
jgi:hypothetical protein